jgi:hypothetical protein
LWASDNLSKGNKIKDFVKWRNIQISF